MRAHLDFETRGTANLLKTGAYRYAEDPNTSVILARYRFDGGPLKGWRAGEPFPQDLVDHVAAGGTVVAHNASFERLMWNVVLKRMGYVLPPLTIRQMDCTMSRAAALALPQGLDPLSKVLDLKIQKDMDGHRLMMKLCKPRRWDADGTVVWWTDPTETARLGVYCGTDVNAECLADEQLVPLSAYERAVWELDQAINDRGIAVDLPRVRAAIETAQAAVARCDERMWRLTEGAVTKCTEAQKIVQWVNARGVPCVSIAKGEVEELVLCAQVVGDKTAEDVIRLRRDAAKSSVSKLQAIERTVCSDGRVHGAINYHTASTGRFGGRLIQPHNFPRIDAEEDMPDVVQTLALLADPFTGKERVAALELMTRGVLSSLSKCLRPMMVAGPGNKLVGADFANIEGRMNAWLAGEMWKLEAFRAYDEGTGPDLYKVGAARVLGIPLELVTSAQRQGQGKVPELACGFQGAVGAFITMAANYGIHIATFAEAAMRTATPEAIAFARNQYTRQNARGVPEDVWVAIRTVVNGWREANAATVQGWWDVQDAAIEAVTNPGLIVPAYGGRVAYVVGMGFLWGRLPSGRLLAYANPRVRWVKTDSVDRKGNPVMKRTVIFDGVDSVTKKWGPQALYGGLQCENFVQGAARDRLVHNMFVVEHAGYPVVLHVHDESVSEVPQDYGSADHYQALMEIAAGWDSGCPITAKAWEGTQYGLK